MQTIKTKNTFITLGHINLVNLNLFNLNLIIMLTQAKNVK